MLVKLNPYSSANKQPTSVAVCFKKVFIFFIFLPSSNSQNKFLDEEINLSQVLFSCLPSVRRKDLFLFLSDFLKLFFDPKELLSIHEAQCGKLPGRAVMADD